MRKTLDTWSNTTFNGEKDSSNYTFLYEERISSATRPETNKA